MGSKYYVMNRIPKAKRKMVFLISVQIYFYRIEITTFFFMSFFLSWASYRPAIDASNILIKKERCMVSIATAILWFSNSSYFLFMELSVFEVTSNEN